MFKSIYVGNIPYSATEDDLRNMFMTIGEVRTVKFINDHETGRFRGYGFVEMHSDSAEKAIEQFNGSSMGGRTLKVNEAKRKNPRAGTIDA